MSMSMTGATGKRGGTPGDVIPKGYRKGQIQQYTPEQLQLHQRMMAFASPDSQLYKQAMGSDEGFADFENYANRQFQEQTGNLASRFSQGGGGPGAMSARRGSGFQNMQTQGAQDFATQLAMQRQGLQRQALNDLRGLSSELLSAQPYERSLIKKQQPAWKQFLLGANERGQDLAQMGVKMAASYI